MGDADPKYTVDPETGYASGPDGKSYQSLKAAYHSDLLKLCDCGQPEEAYNFCRAVLEKCDRRGDRGENWINAEEAISGLIAADPKTAAHALLHLLTNLDVIEHGGSVGGSWLRETGEAIVDAGDITEADLDGPES